MPKMGAEYFEKKRNEILDAALAVCMKKPLYKVSMRDVISESGLSQGGIYRYYSNLDEVLIDLINRETLLYDIKTLVDAAISSGSAPEKVIADILAVWEKTILDNLIGVGKIYYEIGILYVNDKKRLSNFISKILFASEDSYLWITFFQFIAEKIAEGYFTPKIPLDDIFRFHTVSIDGITRDLILYKHYQFALPFPGTLEKGNLVDSYRTALLLLLGGSITKTDIDKENGQ
jgi:AcrR family transcriptional regulator